jgi:HlyD family type I secretion membrane fusion protein
MALLQDELSGLRQLEAKGFYPRNKLRASERELARLQGELATDGAGTSQTDKEIGENRLQILQTRQKFRDDVAAELTKTEIEVNELGAKLVAARDAVERLAVLAPVDGQVQNLKPAGKGSVVNPGGDIAEIVPAEDKLVVETQINPRDVESVHSGQKAELRFTAFSSRTTPVVEGAVQVVSGDRLTDQATHQPYYLARVEVPADQVARLPGELKAGMPVDVMVKSSSRTPLQYLLKPLTDSFARSFKER